MLPIIKHRSDVVVDHSPTCGEGREILTGKDYSKFSVAIFTDIRPTHPHFHKTFDETYLMLEGEVGEATLAQVAQRLLDALAEPMAGVPGAGSQPLRLSASVGIALYDGTGPGEAVARWRRSWWAVT